MNAFLDILSVVLLLVGTVFTLIGGTGLLRLPDVFTRLHGASITSSACWTHGAGPAALGTPS